MRTVLTAVLFVLMAGLMACQPVQMADPASAAPKEATRPLSMFMKGGEQTCYDRSTMPYTAAADLHLHPEPFGGQSIEYDELMTYLEAAEVRFPLLYGIGQTLPHDGECTYYLDCVGTDATPGLKNDFENASNFVEFPQDNIHVGLSMTFPDLGNPENIVAGIELLDAEYPGLFNWMGEVNVHKEALLGNGHDPADSADIAAWADFMAILQERGIPIALHSDLGEDADHTKHVDLMHEILRVYPENKIIWMHMGLSRELVTMPAEDHIALMSEFLDTNPNLSVDISWTVIAEAYYDTPEKKAQYVEFFNAYPTRILPGSDFVASSAKNMDIYVNEVEVTSSILADVSDEAFRAIALGQNYFDLAPGLSDKFEAPAICAN